MARVIRFYENKEPAVGRMYYSFSDIVNEWDDYRLQVRRNYINWLFPNESDDETKLTAKILYKFRTNLNIRTKVILATLRMMLFFGYSIDLKTMMPVPVRELRREMNGIIVGFYNPENYARITRILHFLTSIKMPEMSAMFFCMICMALRGAPDLQALVSQNNVVSDWIRTQPYLIEDRYTAEESLLGTTLQDWEKTQPEDVRSSSVHVADVWSDEYEQ